MNFEFIPLKLVGPFKFGNDVKIYSYLLKNYVFIKHDDPRDADEYIAKNNSHIVYVRDEVIDRVLCMDKLYYKGKNLIGLSVNEFQEILGVEYDDKNDQPFNGEMDYYFDSIECTVIEEVDTSSITSILAMRQY